MAVRDLTRVTVSLDTPVGDDGDTTLGDLRAESTGDLEEEVLEREQEDVVVAALAKLSDDERLIIEARFGTGGREAKSLRDAAREVGVTQARAREIEARRCDAWPPTTRWPGFAKRPDPVVQWTRALSAIRARPIASTAVQATAFRRPERPARRLASSV